MNYKVITYDPQETYEVVFTVHYRKRKPPKREPMWVSELNPTRKRVTRLGLGSGLPELLSPEGLAKVMSSALKFAGEQHLLYITLTLGYDIGPTSTRLAGWSAWRAEWQVAKITEVNQ